MKRIDWQRVYTPIPESLNVRVMATLSTLQDKKPTQTFTLRTVALATALLIVVCGIAYATLGSKTATWFGWLYGDAWQQDIEKGDVASPMLSMQLGDVVYTMEEAVFKKDGDFPGLYVVVRITPAEGSNIVLISEDYSLDDPMGYLLYYGTDETIPDDYLTYRAYADQTGASIVYARAALNDIQIDGQKGRFDFGESWFPQADGSILGTWSASFDQSGLERATSYDLSIWIANWPATIDGLQQKNSFVWQVTIQPNMKED